MRLPQNYYHCFMGNGLDAVLIGYSGSMVPDKICVDRCYWYKSDCYYPEEKLVKVAGRFPMDRPLEHAEGSGWFEIAPLGRTWYEVSKENRKLDLASSDQEFVPKEGILYSVLDFGEVQTMVVTFLYARGSLLVEHYEFSAPIQFTTYMAAGVWVEEGWDTDPFLLTSYDEEMGRISYDLGETRGRLFMHLDASGVTRGHAGSSFALSGYGQSFTKYFSILDNRQGRMSEEEFQALIAPGYEELVKKQKNTWKEYFSASQVHIPDPQFQSFYDASEYHFKAIQNPVSGGLPVNNLRRTWSSHIFWDSYYVHRALLGSNHIPESLHACRFFERTMEQARRHAEVEFGCPGLKWDWEITHDGRKAYGSLEHMKFQVHNNGSYANELWQQYVFTHDEAVLQEFFPIFEGLATFFIKGIVIQTERGWEIGPLVGVHESPVKVRNEGITLAATVDILEHYAEAARILGRESPFSDQCRLVSLGLRQRIDNLYNGRFFVAAEEFDKWTMSSLAVIYPMQVIAPNDPRAETTSQEILARMDEVPMRNGHKWESAWSAGVEATILALQGNGEGAWQRIQATRTSLCQFGGMSEVRMDHEWNMQYFCTAQAAVMTALHSMLLQSDEHRLKIFPAIPASWTTCSFERLLCDGAEVSASFAKGHVRATLRNISPVVLNRVISIDKQEIRLSLEPNEKYVIETA